MKIKWHQIKHYLRHYFIAHRKGHGVHSPFAFLLCEEVFYNQQQFYAFENLIRLRKALLQDNTKIKMEDFGAGSQIFTNKVRLVKNIAKSGISNQKQSELLFRMINFLNAKVCLELGTSIGLNTLYMASVNKNNRVISIDACADLYDYAKNLAKKNKLENIEFINAKFDAVLTEIIEKNKSLDFIYIDGNHSYEATMRYFNFFVEKVNTNTVIVFDDIYWSPGMTKAWDEIKGNQKVKLSIDTFFMGFVFFKEEIKEKIDFKFFI